jgi:seryl-tRNA synthetase
MLDIRLVREQPGKVREMLKRRHKEDKLALLDELLELDQRRRRLQQELDALRARRNALSLEINKAKKAGMSPARLLQEAKELPGKVADAEQAYAAAERRQEDILYRIPNLLDPRVPDGKDATDNPVLRTWGKPKKLPYELKTHTELAERLGVADFEQGVTVAGRGFNYIHGRLALLDLALQRYGIDHLLRHGFTPVIPPMLLNRATLAGAVDLAAFEEVIYKVEGEDLHLIGTAEHALVAFKRDTLFREADLPLRLCAATPCFRKEIGGHGVDTKGLFRMHQFNKVEQVVYTKPEDSGHMLDEMQAITESFFQSLELPYRVIEICAADLGGKFARQYDLEAWFPRQDAYKEVTSCGNCTDYQARRLNIRYMHDGEKHPVHILNNTMVATSRAMVAILENFQQKDGTVAIPKALQAYTGFKTIEPPKAR